MAKRSASLRPTRIGRSMAPLTILCLLSAPSQVWAVNGNYYSKRPL
jgi:hypothetical protein